ncbi:MAG: hypothetical protein KDA45_05380 [Planctomycetales bacterium]|nr:hypothetical protein [Planctomycetales bacterium]
MTTVLREHEPAELALRPAVLSGGPWTSGDAVNDEVKFVIQAQPDDTTCGPTCLQAVYSYFGDEIPLSQVIAEVPALAAGGTLAVLLGEHALRRGYQATIYTYNLDVFDPSWFSERERGPSSDRTASRDFLLERLATQRKHKSLLKLQTESAAYTEFLQLGGTICMQELNGQLIRRFLKRSVPILTGLSSTYLYFTRREIPDNCQPDDVRGYPCGHFVVLCGYDQTARTVSVADPYLPNPLGEEHHYDVQLDRLIAAILLGVLTYDANLLVIEPRSKKQNQSKKQKHR